MRVAVFYPAGDTAWSITQGICNTLAKMGYGVTDCGPDYDGQLDHDIIFVSGPEYLWKKLRERYPRWDSINVPKVGWLHETVEREDYVTNPIAVDGKLPVEELKRFTPHLFTPAIQDQKYGIRFLPFGVDTDMFFPREKTGASIYTGAMYKKRRELLEKYPEVRTLSGYMAYDSVKEYAKGIGEATIVLNLPSLSEASNTRTFEALASRAALVAPAMLYPDSLFEHGEHILYYKDNPVETLLEMKDNFRKISWQGYEIILKRHTMVHRLREILEVIRMRPLRFTRKR